MQNFKKFLKVPKSGYTNNGQNNVTQTEDLWTYSKMFHLIPAKVISETTQRLDEGTKLMNMFYAFLPNCIKLNFS